MPDREHYTSYPRPILWLVPGGDVTAGGPQSSSGPLFTTTVEPFYLSKLPVTNEQFEAFDPGFERSPTSPGDHDPAVGVSWLDAVEYCAWYGGVARKPIRLPSEVEWEHACRAGSPGRWPAVGDSADPAAPDELLWHRGNAGGRTVPPLDGKRANGFGLHAMLGGVWEWTGSVHRPGSASPAGEEAGAGELRVLRGGSFRMDREEISCSLRRGEPPDARFDDAGFRIARAFRA